MRRGATTTALELRRQMCMHVWVCSMYADIIIISTTSTKTHTCCRRHAATIPIERAKRCVLIHESQAGMLNDNNSIQRGKANEGLDINWSVLRTQKSFPIGTFFLRSIENWPRTLISFVLCASVCCCCCSSFMSCCSSRHAVVCKLYQSVPFISK